MTRVLLTLIALVSIPGAALALDGPRGGGGCHGGCGGGGHGGGYGGGHGHGGYSVGIDIDVDASASAQSYASAYARSEYYSESSSGGYFVGGGGVYGGGYALPYAVGGGYGYGGCSPCSGIVPVGPVYAPYGPQGPFVTYQVISSRVIHQREYSREEVSYGHAVSGGYSYERGGRDRYERRERYEDDYARDRHEDYGSDVPYVPRHDAPPPPPPPPSYQDECWRDRTGECG